MKQRSLTMTLIVCVVIAAVLLVAVIALKPEQSEIAAPEAEDQVLQNIPSAPAEAAPVLGDEHYCTLVIDTWTAESGKLTVSTFAQAVLPENIDATAQIELWKDNVVLASQPITLGAGEEDGIYEVDATVTFDIPELSVDDELQLWLTVDMDDTGVLFSNGGGWYLEDGQLMLITG